VFRRDVLGWELPDSKTRSVGAIQEHGMERGDMSGGHGKLEYEPSSWKFSGGSGELGMHKPRFFNYRLQTKPSLFPFTIVSSDYESCVSCPS